jgi:single-strand DNA-binding protein
VFLEGQLQTRKYNDKDGTERYSTEVVLTRFRGELVLLDRADGDRSERPTPAMAGAGESRSFQRDDLDDEIPF